MTFLRGFVFCLLLYLTATLGAITMLYPLLPYLLLPMIGKVYLFRMWADLMLGGYWNTFVVVMMRYVAGINVQVFGDSIDMTEGSIMIMNHRTRLDWLYIWDSLLRFGDLNKQKVVLKSGLKKIPGPGWSMQYGLYVFLKRKWEEDKITIAKIASHFGDICYKPQLLFFPEGTDFTTKSKSISDAFADKNSLRRYDHVLHPRTAGFTHLFHQMKKNKIIDAVYDITVGYPRGFPQSETDIFAGKFPPEVHFHVTRHALSSLPQTQEALAVWCSERWAEKEARLKIFSEMLSFQCEPSPGQRTVPAHILLYRCLVMLFIPILGTYLFYQYALARWLTIAFLILHRVLDTCTEGFDMLQIDIYNKLYGKKRKDE